MGAGHVIVIKKIWTCRKHAQTATPQRKPPKLYPTKGTATMKTNTILFLVFLLFLTGAYVYLHGFAQMMQNVHF